MKKCQEKHNNVLFTEFSKEIKVNIILLNSTKLPKLKEGYES